MNVHLRSTAPGFSEAAYLEANPAIAAAVARGDARSGWHHYLAHGSRESLTGVPAETAIAVNAVREALGRGSLEPLPPAALRQRVHGSSDAATFEQVGFGLASDIYYMASSVSDLPAGGSVLDFGCGCGRVARYLTKLLPEAEYVGVDIDAAAVAWSAEHLSHLGVYRCNEAEPPLDFPSDRFDLVVAVSVFSHLPVTMQHRWLAELARVTKPGGVALMTTLGTSAFQPRRPGERARIDRDGFCYRIGRGTRGLPLFYQTMFVTEAYVRAEWARYLQVVDVIPGAIGGLQDAVLCRKAGSAGAA